MTQSLPPLTLNASLRYDIVKRRLRELSGIRSVLEIGAGGGAVGVRLARDYRYVGLELDPQSFAIAQRRLARFGRGTVLEGDLSVLDPRASFDLVCAFEVLEHIENDRAALTEWRLRLEPGGWLLLSVPAWQRRFGAADRKAGHFRRYDRDQLAKLFAESGFGEVRIDVYGFPLGYVLQPTWNLLARRSANDGVSLADRTAASGRWLQPPEWTGLVTQLVSAPFCLSQRPFATTDLGTGLVALARREG